MEENLINVEDRQRIAAERSFASFRSNFDARELKFFIGVMRESLLLLNGGVSFEDVRNNMLSRTTGHTRNLRKFINNHLFSKNLDFQTSTLKQELLTVERVLCELAQSGEPPAHKGDTPGKKINVLHHDAAMFCYGRASYAALSGEERKAARHNNTFSIDVLSNFRGKCAISGTYHRVEAAHIVPVNMTGDNQPGNGIALAHFLHSVFDEYHFSIHPLTLKLTVAPALRKILAFDGMAIRLPDYMPIKPQSLDFHYENFREVNAIR